MTTLVVMAKECIPGRVKTRLHPPLSLDLAARIAAASLEDTLEMASHAPVHRRVLCFDGEKVPHSAAEWDVIPQGRGGLAARIGRALDACSGPTMLIGMDTPQITPSQLPAEPWPSDIDAWLGPAADGGYWLIGLREPDGDLVRGIPMSRGDTGRLQRRRLEAARLRVGSLDTLTDIDTIESLRAVRTELRAGALTRLLEDELP